MTQEGDLEKGEQKACGGGLYRYKNARGGIEFFLRSRRVLGEEKRQWLGAIPRSEAEAILAEKVLVAQGFEIVRSRRVLDLGPPTPTPLSYTFLEASQLWFEDLLAAGRDPKTTKRYRYDIQAAAPLLDPSGKKPLGEIRPEDAKHLRAELLRRGIPFRTRKNVEHTSSMLFGYAIDPSRGWATRNPFDSLLSEKAPKKTSKRAERFRRLHPREDADFLAAVALKPYLKEVSEKFRSRFADADAAIQCALAVGLYLGAREKPVACLRVEDVNLFASAICTSGDTQNRPYVDT